MAVVGYAFGGSMARCCTGFCNAARSGSGNVLTPSSWRGSSPVTISRGTERLETLVNHAAIDHIVDFMSLASSFVS